MTSCTLEEAVRLICMFDERTFDQEGNALGEYDHSWLTRFILDIDEFGNTRGRSPGGRGGDSRFPRLSATDGGDVTVELEDLVEWWGLRGRELYALIGEPDVAAPDEQ